MTFRLRNIFPTLAIILAGGIVAGCQSDSDQDETLAPGTYLQFAIRTADLANGSRAADWETDDTYPASESDVLTNELIHTMRVIVVDEAGNVEHNIFLDQAKLDPEKPQTALIKTNSYKVKPDEEKTVYLIGNEASIIADEAIARLISLQRGEPFIPADKAANYILSAPGDGEPFFAANALIPMTEIHKIKIGGLKYQEEPEGSAQNIRPEPYRFTLFTTRVATKFQINFEVRESVGSNGETYVPEVKNVTISSIGNKEYLFPDATYSPAKKPIYEADDPSGGADRMIIDYAVPYGVTNQPFIFPDVEAVKIPDSETGYLYSWSNIYLPETALAEGQKYIFSADVDGVTKSAELPNLPSLPRNTYVIINVNATTATIQATVTLHPYTGVWLDPDFGINRPKF